MKRFLIASVLALLFTSCTPAQQRTLNDYHPYTVTSMDVLLAARAKLIQRYAGTVARGVAICGKVDLLNGDISIDSYLVVYVYRDSVNAFALDFNKFATPTPKGGLGVDGVNVAFQIIQRSKKQERLV